jgi:hypothetical protein
MEGDQPQAHQELGQQGPRHHFPGEEAEGRGAQGAEIATTPVQGAEGSQEEIDERAAQAEAKAEGAQ